MWALISTPLLNLLREEGCGAYFQTSIVGEQIHFVGYSFVDDTDLLSVPQDKAASYHSVGKDMQHSVTAWEGGLRATGGAIVPEKSFWYLVDFKWKAGKWTYKSIAETPYTIQVRDAAGTLQTLRRLPLDQAERTLGVRIAPDGNNKAEAAYLRNCAQEWADKVRTGSLSDHLAWQALTCTIMAKLKYPLTATTFTRAQCQHIFAPLRKVGLPRSKIASNFPAAMLHAPLDFQGLDLPDLFFCQGQAHLDKLITFTSSKDSMTGSLLRASAETMKLERGINGPLFSPDYSTWKTTVTRGWIQHTWQWLYESDIQVQDSVPDFPTRRINDQLIMEFFESIGCTPKDLASLNRCRLFLKVLSLADIVNGQGTEFMPGILEGNPNSAFLTSQLYDWPNQGKPPKQIWNLWQTKLGHLLDRSKKLRRPLGDWTDSSSVKYWTSPDSLELYSSGPTNLRFTFQSGRYSRSNNRRFAVRGTPSTRPEGLLPTAVFQRGSFLISTGSSMLRAGPEPNDPFRGTFLDRIHRRSADAGWALHNFKIQGRIHRIIQAIQDGSLLTMSDGSFAHGVAVASWRIGTADELHSISADVVTPGPDSAMDAYRAELSGIYGMLLTLFLLSPEISGSPEVTIINDALFVLRDVFSDRDHAPFRYKHHDLIGAAKRLISEAPISFLFQHVNGSVVKTHMREDMTQIERWNADMDRRAGYWRTDGTLPPRQLRIWKEPWTVSIGGQRICNNVVGQLKAWYYRSTVERYWHDSERLPTSVFSRDLDTIVTGLALKEEPVSRRRWISKSSSGFCGTHHMEFKRKNRDSPACSRCDFETETFEHTLRCSSVPTQERWPKAIAELREELEDLDTDPTLIELIISRLSSWFDETHLPPINLSDPRYAQLIASQDVIGWYNFFMGLPSIHWRRVQALYYARIRSQRSSKKWLVALIRKQWQIAWDLWQIRNDAVHSIDQGEAIIRCRAQIQNEYEVGCRNLPNNLKKLFRCPLETMLTKSLATQAMWLERIITGRFRAAESPEIAQLDQMRSTLARWIALIPSNSNHRRREPQVPFTFSETTVVRAQRHTLENRPMRANMASFLGIHITSPNPPSPPLRPPVRSRRGPVRPKPRMLTDFYPAR